MLETFPASYEAKAMTHPQPPYHRPTHHYGKRHGQQTKLPQSSSISPREECGFWHMQHAWHLLTCDITCGYRSHITHNVMPGRANIHCQQQEHWPLVAANHDTHFTTPHHTQPVAAVTHSCTMLNTVWLCHPLNTGLCGCDPSTVACKLKGKTPQS